MRALWLTALLFGCVSSLGGASTRQPEEAATGLGSAARALVDQAFADIDPARLIDHHTHVVGLGTAGTGAYVNWKMQRPVNYPFKRLKFAVYADAARIRDLDQADQQWMQRLTQLVEAIPRHGRHLLLAFDQHYDHAGRVITDETEFHTPDAYVFQLAEARPDLFVPAISVHPYRKDAVQALERGAARGARFVKWLPNAMGIDPADPQVDAFYDAMKRLGMVLLTHAGEEKAVDAEEAQKYGNPLRLRRALDKGVTVVVAHCASLGQNADLDAPEAGRPQVDNFDLFMRLMDEPRYVGLLFGEVSAMTQANRLATPLATLLTRTDLHPRLINGSDYPLPAINVVVRTGALESAGFITAEERAALNEIYDFNPLLFDFVLKRTVKAPGSGERFAASIFHENPALPVKQEASK